MAKIFYTPPGYSGTGSLTASTGLEIVQQGLWKFSQSGYNDGATFGLSLTHPKPNSGDLLHLRAVNWPIPVIGNVLTSYDDPDLGLLPASQCRIQIAGSWTVIRQQNSNSFNGTGVSYTNTTETDLGGREGNPNLLTYSSYTATYVIQGASVTGGAQDTFTQHEFYVRCTESARTDNSNKEYQSNTITRPSFDFSYAKSWEIEI